MHLKTYWKAIGIAVIGEVVLYYPIMRLMRALLGREERHRVEDSLVLYIKAFAPAYRGKHLPHRRHNPNYSDGHS